MADIPSVVIVGRPNVGKSSLFNAICRERVAIVEPTPGVTRDRISRVVERPDARFELVDTGGIGLHDSDALAEHIQAQIAIAIEQADLVLLVVDLKAGPQPFDAEIANELRTAGKRVLLVVNKADGGRNDEPAAAEFYSLGYPTMSLTSAEHRRGIRPLVERLVEALPESRATGEQSAAPDEPMKIAFVGRRNVGKSSLVNCLAREPRVVVSEIPGTTRDSVDVRFEIGSLTFTAIDTAGLRRRKQVKGAIDFYSTARTEGAIRRADVVVLMIEAPMEVGRLDKQLAEDIVNQYKPCVVAVNKMDLAPDVQPEEFARYVRDRLPMLAFAPVVCISAKTGGSVSHLIEAAQALHEQGAVRVPTGPLNRAIQDAVGRRPPPRTSSRFGRIYYATQVAIRPPTVTLFTNEPRLIDDVYLRYLGNRLRGEFGFNAIPIRFVLRGRRAAPAGKDASGHDD
jgi:GTP-binding protein